MTSGGGDEGRPKAVLFDIGNVVVRWDPRTLYSKIFPDPAERDHFLTEVCTLPWHMQHDAGVSWNETVPALIAEHPRHADAITAWRDRWWEMFSGAIPETEEAIEALHARGVPLYGLTNMAIETVEGTMGMSPVTQRFRDVIVSGQEKVMKPDRRIFEIVCERSGLTPPNFLFIDDTLHNIQAAAMFADKAAGKTPADDLTFWDRAYLGALYNAPSQTSLSAQRSIMSERIAHAIEVLTVPDTNAANPPAAPSQ